MLAQGEVFWYPRFGGDKPPAKNTVSEPLVAGEVPLFTEPGFYHKWRGTRAV